MLFAVSRSKRTVLSFCFVCFIGMLVGCEEESNVHIPPCPNCALRENTLWSDVNLSLYEQFEFHVTFVKDANYAGSVATVVQSGLNFENVRPNQKTDYWEIRYPYDPDEPERVSIVVVKVGTKCGTANDQERCLAAFDAIRPSNAMQISSAIRNARLTKTVKSLLRPADVLACTPSMPIRSVPFYIASNHGDENHVWAARNEILEFFGNLDSKEEAVLLMAKDDFYGYYGYGRARAIREVDSEYELLVNKTKSFFHANRYLLRLSPSGEVRILREQESLFLQCG